MDKVLWNSEMDLCIGLRTEMDEHDFIENAKAAHEALSGDILQIGDYTVSQEIDGLAWKLEVVSPSNQVEDVKPRWEVSPEFVEKIKGFSSGDRITLVKKYPSGVIGREKATFEHSIKEEGWITAGGGWYFMKSRHSNADDKRGSTFRVKMYRCSTTTRVAIDANLLDVESGWKRDD